MSVRLTRYTYYGSLYSILSTTFNINLDSDSAWAQVPLWDRVYIVLPKCSCKVMHITLNVLIFMEHIGGPRPPYPNIGGASASPFPTPMKIRIIHTTIHVLLGK